MSLSIAVHGEPGAGKSRLSWTMPAPRLILDAEGRSRFFRGSKATWDGRSDPMEFKDVEQVAVIVKDFGVVQTVRQWIMSEKHPFVSVGVDSITAGQKRCIKQIAGLEQPSERQWGEILRSMEDFVTELVDLATADKLRCVYISALSHMRDGWYRPFVKGQLELSLPALVDAVGYLWVDDKSQEGEAEPARVLELRNVQPYLGKDNTGALPARVRNPNLTELVELTEVA